MADDVLSVVARQLSPDLFREIAFATGADFETAQRACLYATPVLLAYLSQVAKTPEGADLISAFLDIQQGAPMRACANDVSGSVPRGRGAKSLKLAKLMGEEAETLIALSVAKSLGLRMDKAKALLGILAPFILRALAQYQQMRGADAEEIAELLRAQRRDFERAFAPYASKSPIPDLFAVMNAGVRRGADTTHAFARRAMDDLETVIAQSGWFFDGVAAKRASANIYWIMGLLALGALIVTFGRVDTQRPQTGVMHLLGAQIDGQAIPEMIAHSVSDVQAMLGAIEDSGSARAAQAKIQRMVVELERANLLAGQLPQDVRRKLSDRVSVQVLAVNKELERVMALPGADASTRARLDALRIELALLSSA
jgi:hypothetical protein